METATELLLIIVSATLTVFLIVAIVLMQWVLKFVKQASRLADKAETVVDKAENVTAFFQKAAVPAAFGKIFATVVSSLSNHSKGGSAKGGKR